MSLDIKIHHSLTPTTLIDEVMSVFRHGENALFADLARTTCTPQATLATLTATLPDDHQACDAQDEG